MKKTLLSMMACMGLLTASATTTTFVMTEVDPGDITGTYTETTYKADGSVDKYAHWQPLESLVLGNYTFTFDQGNKDNTFPAFYTAKEGGAWTVRVYKGNTFTVTSAGETFNQITFCNYNNKGELSASAGSVTNDDKNIIWNGEATNTVTFTIAENCRFETITFSDEGNGAVEPPVKPTVQMAEFAAATEFEAGMYVFVTGDKVANGYCGADDSKAYGYLNVGDFTFENGNVITEKDRAYTFEAVEGGYSLKNGYGKYVYMSGEYNSVNLADAMPEEGGVWTVAINDNGLFVMTNVAKQKTMQFDSNYNSFGFYPDVRGEYPVFYKYVKDVEGGSTPVDPVDPPVTPTVQMAEFAKATEFAAGQYVFVVSYVIDEVKVDKVANGYCGADDSKAYGYLNVGDFTFENDNVITEKDRAYTFEAVEGGYSLKNGYGKYVYMSGEYNSVNLADAMPEEGGVWTVAINDNGLFVMTNVAKQKTMQFDPNYNSFGFYPDVRGEYPVFYKYVKDVEGSNTLVDQEVITNAPAEYYNINGVRVANPEKGLYIVRQGNKTSKVIIK